jgi:hypothetical protein
VADWRAHLAAGLDRRDDGEEENEGVVDQLRFHNAVTLFK